jgi:predicted dehydrogenase/threonine dehydrogenase-like Zn-dependent dehydrogenase
MRQVIRKGLKHIIVDQVPDPVATPHHVIVQPAYSLISSGTETASIHQEALIKEVAENPSHLAKIWNVMKTAGPTRTIAEVRAKFQEYAVLGYAGAGIVVDKHPSVQDLNLGDRVAYGGEGTGHGEYIQTGRNLVARIPDSVGFDEAAFSTLGAIALNAVRIASISIGDVVAVIGQGLVGQLISQLVRAQGGIAIAIDLKQDRLQLSREMGAPYAAEGGPALAGAVRGWTRGRGADHVIIAAAAKSAGPCHQALEIVRDRGRIVIVGAVDVSFPWHDAYMKEVQVLMARAYGPGSYDPVYERKGQDYPVSYVRWTENRNMEEFLRLVSTGAVTVRKLITHQFALDDATKAYETIMNPATDSLAVVLRYPEPQTAPVQPPSRHSVTLAPSAPKGSDEIRFALVGAGNLARWAHVPNLKQIPGVRLHAVYSTSGARGVSYGLRFQASYAATSYEEILRDPSIDCVLIVSRNPEHARQAVQALDAGKHVFVEKPMALTIEETREVHQAVQRSGRQLTVGFNRRFAPYYIQVQQQLTRRTGPAVLHCRMNSPGISGSYWMADPSIGGAILGEACHFVDLFCWLLKSEVVSLNSFSLPTGKADPVGENNLVTTFRFADDSIATLTYCTVGSRTSGGERLEVFAPGIGAVTEDFCRLWIRGARETKSSKLFPDKGYPELMRDFVKAVRAGTPPAVTVDDGARSTILCLEMLTSAQTLTPRSVNWRSLLEA